MLEFSDIEDAFLFVSSAGYGMHSAVLCKDTGRILSRSEMGDLDEIGNEDLDCVEIGDVPDKLTFTGKRDFVLASDK